jgi:glycosyltransferase involved in cell wall biosynthesis
MKLNKKNCKYSVLTSYRSVSGGGASKKYIQALNSMINAGWEVHCISNIQIPIVSNNFKIYKSTKLINQGNIGFLFSLFKLSKKIIKNNQIDMIFAFHPFQLFIMDKASSLFKSKIFKVISVRGNFEFESYLKRGKIISFLFSMIESIILKRVDLIIPVNNDLKKKFIEKYHIKSTKINVLFNSIGKKFVPSDNLRKKFRGKNKKKDKDFIIGFIGNFGKIKGLKYLIKAMKKLVNEIPNCYLFIAGSEKPFSESKNKLMQHNQDKMLSDRIKFLGNITNPAEFINGVDIVVVPSLYEGCPSVVLESIGCEKLVIGSNVGGVKEILSSDKLLFAPRNFNEIYLKILSIFNDIKLNKLCLNLIKDRKSLFMFNWDFELIKIIKNYSYNRK